ncbi:hypothetical protein DL95DRAFT_384036 [Leptodontidium sp. 2 PMI_412]|nr:hypothetical protein DL95DRAFT_384036 [Leptodontidium sp. 2 PMI_412]
MRLEESQKHGVFQLSCIILFGVGGGAIGLVELNRVEEDIRDSKFDRKARMDGRGGKDGARTKPNLCWLLYLFLLYPGVVDG